MISDKKIEVNDQYIDTVIAYLNTLLNSKTKGHKCGMCAATEFLSHNLAGYCEECPLSVPYTGICCANRSKHLVNKRNSKVLCFNYNNATKESIITRVQWIIDQVNSNTTSNWCIYLEDAE